MAIINDTDLLVVQKGGNNYTYSGAQLKDDMREFGSGGTSPTPSLAQVCAVGSNTGRGIFVQGQLSVQVNGVDTGIGDFGISTESNIGCNGSVTANAGSIVNNFNAGSFSNSGGQFVVDSVGGVYTTQALSAPGGANSRDLIIRGSGDANVGLLCTRGARSLPEVQAATAVSTGQFLNVLDNIEIIKYEDGDISVRPDTLYNDEHSRFLNFEGQEFEVNHRHLTPYLIGVCKEQQALIESLTTRIEQLEADHASAMNNMEDENGSSAY